MTTALEGVPPLFRGIVFLFFTDHLTLMIGSFLLGPGIHRVGALPQQWGTEADRVALISDGESSTFHQLDDGSVPVVLRQMLLTTLPSECPCGLLIDHPLRSFL